VLIECTLTRGSSLALSGSCKPRTPLQANAEVIRAPTAYASLKQGTGSFRGEAGAELTACVLGCAALPAGAWRGADVSLGAWCGPTCCFAVIQAAALLAAATLTQSAVPAAISTLVTAVEILKNGNWAVETSALLAGLPCVKDPAPLLRGAEVSCKCTPVKSRPAGE